MAYVFGSIWDRINRNALNKLSKSVEQQGKSIQDLVAKGQLTPEEYTELITIINSNLKSGEVGKFDLTTEFKDEIEGLSTQLAQTQEDKISHGDVSVRDIDKNKGKFDQSFMSDEFLEQIAGTTPINAVPADESLTTEKFANKSVSLPKIYNPFGILPKGISFIIDAPSITRVISENVFLREGDKIVISDDNISMAVYYLDNDGNRTPSHTQGWINAFEADESRSHVIRAKFNDDSDVRNRIELIASNVFVENQNVAIKKNEFEDAFVQQFSSYEGVPELEFLQGNISGADGTYTGVAMSGVSVVHLQLYEGESVRLKNTNDFQMALWVEGETSYHDGWNTTEYIAQTDKVISFMVRRNDSSRLDVEIAPSLIEYNSNQAFARRGDLANFSGGAANNMLYPSYPVWGHEYLYSWYEKLRINQSVKMTWAGDSTTNNSNMLEEFRRHSLGKKIMTLGGYDETLVTSINAGHGSQHTGNWLGGDKDPDKRTPNGFLDEDMLGNPDLYVFAYGFNDGSNSHFGGLTWQQRIDRFEENLIEGLERIRGAQYNKSPDDMAIILCTPIAAYDSGRGNTPPVWNDKIRPIIQKACRDYNCAFVDITARQYDHGFSGSWSANDDFVHPNATANADYMSMFEPLIFPRLLQN